MSFHGDQAMYRCHPIQRREQSIIGDWIVDRHDDDSTTFREYEIPTSMMPMRRFMDEPSCTPLSNATHSVTATLPPFQSLDIASYAYPTSAIWPYSMGPGLPSPPLSGQSSSCFSSCASDRQDTPYSPPDTSFLAWSPEIVHADNFGLGFGGEYHFSSEQEQAVGHPCVALHDVQSYEDPQPEKVVYDDDTHYFGSYASAPHEGYQPIEPNGEVADSGVETDDNDSRDDDYTPRSPNCRRRRPQPIRSVTSPRSPTKVTKRSAHVRRSSAPHSRSAVNAPSSQSAATPNRAFPCALANYGCAATFGSKNEWKRHVNTQHMRLAYWRCDQCDSGKKHNDFNRKDLFIQHVRRMHPIQATAPSKKTAKQIGKPVKGSTEDQTFSGLAERCFKRDRSPPDQSGCHFCDATFEEAGKRDEGLWDKRLEHVAQHMERAKKDESNASDPSSWHEDARLEHWLIENGIVVEAAGGRGLALA